MDKSIEDIVRAASHDICAPIERWSAATFGDIDWSDKDDPIVNIREQISNRIADQVARMKDQIIIGALVPHLGPSIVLKTLVGRLKCFKRQPTDYEDWELDGRLVLRIWPPEIDWKANMVNITQRFNRFDENGELVP